MSTLSWVVVATENEPARAQWSRAAREAAIAQPRFVSWSQVMGSEARFQADEIVFAERLYPTTAENPVGGQQKRYADLQAALLQLDAAVTKAGARLAAPVGATLLALDRVRLHEFLKSNGLPVPELSDVSQAGSNILRPRYAGSDDWVIDNWRTRLFRHRTRNGLEVWRGPAQAPIDRADLPEVAALLAADGVHAVKWLQRMFRLALVDGKVTHAAGVERDTVILRPWYGGPRKEIDSFLDRFGMQRWERVVALAERTATFFPGFRSLGVDLIMDNESSEFVFDVDPFGASLPGLVSALPGAENADREPVSVRAAVLRSLSAGW